MALQAIAPPHSRPAAACSTERALCSPRRAGCDCRCRCAAPRYREKLKLLTACPHCCSLLRSSRVARICFVILRLVRHTRTPPPHPPPSRPHPIFKIPIRRLARGSAGDSVRHPLGVGRLLVGLFARSLKRSLRGLAARSLRGAGTRCRPQLRPTRRTPCWYPLGLGSVGDSASLGRHRRPSLLTRGTPERVQVRRRSPACRWASSSG